MKRFFLSQDHDCHWYLIPVDLEQEWSAWLDLDPDDERAWFPPDGVFTLGGAPSAVTFTNPLHYGEEIDAS